MGVSTFAAADNYPSKPIKVVVGTSAGGPTDFVARLYTDKVATTLGQIFVVDNKVGASGTLAADSVSKSPADGYTLLMGAPSSIIVAPYMYSKLGYDPAKDLVPVSMTSYSGYVLAVHPSVPARTAEELVALLRAKPGTLAFGSGGAGTGSHLCGELYSSVTGGRLVHVPYKGDGPALNDLLGGQIQIMFTTSAGVLPHVKSGKVRILGVTTKERVQSMQGIPTIHEAGLKDFECLSWTMLFAPAGTPKPALDKLNAAWAKERTQGTVKARLDELDWTPPDRFSSQESLNLFLKNEQERLGKIIRGAGIKPE